MNKPKYKTREEWLNAACEAFKPLIEAKGFKWVSIRVSVGWPSRGALSKKRRTIGQCWPPCASEDKATEIFISPVLAKPEQACNVLDTLLHEIGHAVVGCEHGHKKPFKRFMAAVGLSGKATATFAGEELLHTIKGIYKDLGPFPHGILDRVAAGLKKQTTRMIKCECLCSGDDDGTCGFIVRASRSALVEIGIPACPKHGIKLHCELPDED